MNAETALLYGIICMSWAEYAWNFYITMRQRSVIKSSDTIPPELQSIFTEEKFSKARLYNWDNITFGLIHSLCDNIIGTLMIVIFVLPGMWKMSENILQNKFGYTQNEIITSIIFMLLLNTLNTVISLPFSIYQTFVIEEKHGFNKQTPLFFVKDSLKAYVLVQFLIVLITAPVIYIIRAGGQYFFVYLWLFALIFTLFLMTIYPEVIAPLFDKYTPLPEGELRTKIEELAASVNFPLKKIYVVEGSKRSAHSNAYFYGFYKNKRIVLFDTLLKGYVSPDDAKDKNPDESAQDPTDAGSEKDDDTDSSTKNMIPESSEKEKQDNDKGCTTDEVLAVLGHELGHWKMNHVLKQMILSEVNLFVLFMAFSALYQYDIIYRAFGFYDAQPALIGMLVIMQFIFSPYHFILQFLVTVLTRKQEFEADAFAKDLGKAEYLKKALVKLNHDNLGFPIHDWLYSMFTHSHPQLLERIRAVDETKSKHS